MHAPTDSPTLLEVTPTTSPEVACSTAHSAVELPSLKEQLQLFSGLDNWHFQGCKSLGFPPLQVADCGHGVTLVAPPFGSATCFPTSIGMAATWNRALIKEVGRALGRETRAKNCGMLLAPMVNLHRLPCGGRNYETFSEDPVLTGKMAAALICGIQSEGTGACIKSFACNNQQQDQKSTSAEVDPKTLRELYLKAFAIAFEESDPWAVMTSYNAINGTHPSDSAHWINEVLHKEMGYLGLVVSDWHSIQGDDALLSGLDIEMPGPGKTLTADRLQQALDIGLINEAEINRRARRVLELHQRCTPARLGDATYSPPELDSPRHRELSRKVAEESIVLLKNDHAFLPLNRTELKRIAVIGPNANSARLGGGGSASVSPFYSVSPLAGIRTAAGESIEVVYAEGCSLGNARPSIPQQYLAPPQGQFGDGLQAEYFEVAAFYKGDSPAKTQLDPSVDFSWGWAAPATDLPREHFCARWSGQINLPEAGRYNFAVSTQEGLGRVILDGNVILDAWSNHDATNFEDSYTNHLAECEIDIESSRAIPIVVEYRKTGTRGGIHLGWKAPFHVDPIAEAVTLAKEADAVIIVGGLSNVYEGGSYDRRTFELPGRQSELIQAVTAANPKTVVVLKNGSPVSFKGWLTNTPAVLEAFYPGQEGGNAIGRILFGEVNPSGKLPDTCPNSWDEVPSMQNYPGKNGKAVYAEKLMVGYRHYDSAGIPPEFPFGYGLSYTQFTISAPQLNCNTITTTTQLTVTVEVKNIGTTVGSETVQLYLETTNPSAGTPPRKLIDFCKIQLNPDEQQSVRFKIRYKDLLTYNTTHAAWHLENTRFNVAIGAHSRDLQTAAFTAHA